jgi:hypothetical protein
VNSKDIIQRKVNVRFIVKNLALVLNLKKEKKKWASCNSLRTERIGYIMFILNVDV